MRGIEREDLPKGWVLAKIGEVCTLVNGRAFKPTEWCADGIPIVRIQNLNNPAAPFNYFQGTVDDRFYIDTDDLLFAWSGTPGTSFGAHIWRGGRALLNQHIFRVLVDERVVDKRYFRYALNAKLASFIERAHGGVGLRHITKGKFEATPIALPSLSEQRRIVAKIEELFSDLDAGVAALQAAQRQLQRYRQSVLKAAVEGKLTEAWRRQHGHEGEPADVLLARILAERRERWEAEQRAKYEVQGKEPPSGWQKRYKEPAAPETGDLPELPEGWMWVRVAQVGDVQLGRQRSPQHHQGDHMRPYLRVANVYEDRIDLTDVKEMNFTPEEFEVYKLAYGDILLNEGQSLELVGRPAMFKNEVDGCCFQNTLVRFRAFDGLDRRYALLVFRAYLHTGRFQRIASWTTSIAHLGASRFAEMEFPLPPAAEQAEIVQEVERLLSVATEVEQAIEHELQRAERLRQGILKRAFSGKLVPQDPNDEPAEALLARIQGVQKQPSKRARRPAEQLSMDL